MREIHDGYTFTKTFPAALTRPETTIKYRPMLRPERQAVVQRVAGLKKKAVDYEADMLLTDRMSADERKKCQSRVERMLAEAEKITCAAVAARISEWDLVDEEGAPLPITVEAISKIDANLFELIYGVVANWEDQPPQDGEAEPASDDSRDPEDKTAGN